MHGVVADCYLLPLHCIDDRTGALPRLARSQLVRGNAHAKAVGQRANHRRQCVGLPPITGLLWAALFASCVGVATGLVSHPPPPPDRTALSAIICPSRSVTRPPANEPWPGLAAAQAAVVVCFALLGCADLIALLRLRIPAL